MERIRLGYPDNPLHEASAAAVARVLEAHDLEVEPVPAAPDALPAAIAADGMDMFACAWLPRTDASLLAGGRMQPIGLLYRPAFIWCVTEPGITGIGELAGASDLDRHIPVPASGPIAARSFDVFEAYRLEAAGFHIETVSDAEAEGWAQETWAQKAGAQAAGAARIVPLCRPHHLLHAAGLHVLEDPLEALGPEQEARLLIRRDLRGSLDSDLLDELDELTLGNKVVSAMAHAMRVGGMSAEEAADAWQRGKLTPRA